MEVKEYLNIPTVTLRGLVMFPTTATNFDMERKITKSSVKASEGKDNLIVLVTQKDIRTESPKEKDLYNIGLLAKVRQVLHVTPDISRVIITPIERVKIKDIKINSKLISSDAVSYPMSSIRTKAQKDEVEALMRIGTKLTEEYFELNPMVSQDILLNALEIKSAVKYAEYLTTNLFLSVQNKQEILEETSPLLRIRKLVQMLQSEVEILKIESEINARMRQNIDENQKDYYLREQMKVISEQLGEDVLSDTTQYKEKIKKLKISDKDKEKLLNEVSRLEKMPSSSQESAVVRQYLDTCLKLPFGVFTKEEINIKKIESDLDKDHYGLKKIKERIVEMLAVRKLAPNIKGQIICFVGPPGVGKTSIAKSIADSIGRKYARISLGGIRDEADIRGHRKTYIGAMPGRIIDAISQAGSANPLLLFDEIDKMGNDFRGDPASAMLEVLDPEQNKEFVDHYIEIPFDLSQVLFIMTANTLSTIPRPLIDRMEIIEISTYTREEKINIAKRHLVKKQIAEHGLNASQLKISDGAIYSIIDGYTRESGVRNLERTIAKLCRKSAKKIVSGDKKNVSITVNNIKKYLGNIKFKPEIIKDKTRVGSVNGLAWTSVGGEVMPIEVNIMPGTGKIELTGSLGDVIKESARIAISFVRSRAISYGIDPDFYKKCDIHIHAPEGAVPKDGPSAGVTMVTALVSALGNYEVRQDVAMTGEVTLRGQVLAIGGLREKSMAAYRAGALTVLIPNDNLGDLEEIDDIVKKSVKFIPAKHVEDVLTVALKEFKSQPNIVFPIFAENVSVEKSTTVV